MFFIINRTLRGFSSTKHTLIAVRQGENIWNKEKKWAGWMDVPLSDNGIIEVK
jgi:bisphosphoglycerate-dependent phosphoglycerate mutase